MKPEPVSMVATCATVSTSLDQGVLHREQLRWIRCITHDNIQFKGVQLGHSSSGTMDMQASYFVGAKDKATYDSSSRNNCLSLRGNDTKISSDPLWRMCQNISAMMRTTSAVHPVKGCEPFPLPCPAGSYCSHKYPLLSYSSTRVLSVQCVRYTGNLSQELLYLRTCKLQNVREANLRRLARSRSYKELAVAA